MNYLPSAYAKPGSRIISKNLDRIELDGLIISFDRFIVIFQGRRVLFILPKQTRPNLGFILITLSYTLMDSLCCL